MGGANKLDPTRFRFSPIEKTSIDPIARVMRKECRKRGIKGLTVLWSDEPPRRARPRASATTLTSAALCARAPLSWAP